jgi:hypothetical protein
VAGKAEAATPVAPPPPQPKTREVAPGDSLSSIAEQEKLASWRPLWDVNPEVQDPDVIYAGQKLVVPTGPTTERPLPYVAPAPAPVQQQQTYQAPVQRRAAAAPANYAQGAGGIMANIRQRESGGNYAINTGNGYYGAYQFDLATWRSNGGSGYPHEASPAEQDRVAAVLYSRRGCNPWPNTCY